MSSVGNGNRRPPRPRIEMLGPAAADEAAAIVAAVERFLAETAPAPAPDERANPWQRAALLEGVSAKDAVASPWGEATAWGERQSRRA